MDMMTITQLAQQTDLAPPTIRRYLDDFILYVPSVRVDNTIGFPPEAVTVIETIHSLTEHGHSHSEIVAKLEETYPITVISAQPLGEGQSIPSSIPAITGLLRAVDDRYGALVREISQIRFDLDTYTETGPLAHVPAELGQIRQVISMLARRVAEVHAAGDGVGAERGAQGVGGEVAVHGGERAADDGAAAAVLAPRAPHEVLRPRLHGEARVAVEHVVHAVARVLARRHRGERPDRPPGDLPGELRRAEDRRRRRHVGELGGGA